MSGISQYFDFNKSGKKITGPNDTLINDEENSARYTLLGASDRGGDYESMGGEP
jgi:hypothetical protein